MILSRIRDKDKTVIPPERSAKKRNQDISRKLHPRKNLIDTSGDKFQESTGLKKWADRQNRKDLMEIQYYLSKYKENVGYRRKYDEAVDKEKILQSYEEQLALFDLAKEKLQGYGIIPNIRELDRVTADLKELE